MKIIITEDDGTLFARHSITDRETADDLAAALNDASDCETRAADEVMRDLQAAMRKVLRETTELEEQA